MRPKIQPFQKHNNSVTIHTLLYHKIEKFGSAKHQNPMIHFAGTPQVNDFNSTGGGWIRLKKWAPFYQLKFVLPNWRAAGSAAPVDNTAASSRA